MKTAIILVLLLALVGVMAATKPDKDSFKSFLIETRAKEENNWLKEMFAEQVVSAYADNCRYDNYILWSMVKNPDGQNIYIGIAGRWVGLAELKQVADEIKKTVPTK